MKIYVTAHVSTGFGAGAIRFFTNAGKEGEVHNGLRIQFEEGERDYLLKTWGKRVIKFTDDMLLESRQGLGVHAKPFREFYPDISNIKFLTFEERLSVTESAKWDMVHEAVRLLGSDYDWTGIWGHVRRRKRENPDKWYCTEYDSHVLRKGFVTAMNMPDWKLTPFVFSASPIFTEVTLSG